MKDQLSGRIPLVFFTDTESATGLAGSCDIRTENISRRDGLLCAILGAPRLAPGNGESGLVSPLVMMDLWERYGESLPSKLHGAYAFALVDGRRGCVFMAVDRFAAQTLCYRLAGDALSFSDRADTVPGRGNEIDPQAIYNFLFFHMIPAPRTIFPEVMRLPAAHALYVDKNGSRLVRHWPLNFNECHKQPFKIAKQTFQQLIREAVGDEIEGQKEVGAFLSGGTDSSTVAGMLTQTLGRPAKTYSIGFEAEGYDEMDYARLAARHFGCDHHEYYVTPQDLIQSIPAVAQYHDQPFGNSSALPAYYCARMAREDGCSKLLAGDGGDELFGGNSRYATQRIFELYRAVPQPLRQMIEPLCGDSSVLRRVPVFKQATGYVRHSRVPMPDRLQTFNLLLRLDPCSILTENFLDRIDQEEPSRHMRQTWGACSAGSLVNRMLAYDWVYTLADSDLPKVRGATAMAGIEVGYPLLADALADFSLELDPEWKLKRLKLRWFFKEALRGFLPDDILTKKKHGFGLPFGPWMARNDGLRKLAGDSLLSLAERGIVQSSFVEKLLVDYLPQHPGYYGEMVWILMMLEQWMRGYGKLSLKL